MFNKVITPRASRTLLWQALAVCLPAVLRTGGLSNHHVVIDTFNHRVVPDATAEELGLRSDPSNVVQAMGVNGHGGVFYTEAEVRDAIVVRREARAGQSGSPAILSGSGEVLLQTEGALTTGSAKIVIVVIISLGALVSFCALAIWLVWAPMNAIFEERAYEQAARAAFEEAAPAAPVEQPEGVTEPLVPTQEQNLAYREEQIGLAWKKFLDNKLLQIDRTNLLARCMHKLLGDKGFDNQMEDLFGGLTKEGEDTIKRDSLERVIEGISGILYNMHVKERISEVKFVKGRECSMAVADVEEDYRWLFKHYDTVFPENLPMDRKCFDGVMKLVLVWNCVRTLHTARHMKVEHHDKKATSAAKSNTVAVHIKIDARQGFPLEANAEIVVEDEKEGYSRSRAKKKEVSGDGSKTASASASAEPKLKRKDSWSDDQQKRGGNDDDDVAP